ncbi:MAG: hypothetical protein GWN00_14305 [Aliifodinibius sp.]|nr:hypothetical protein [candidate division Zixibacteria bacterium]NIT57353.1 hypothetical protein [Fodinibius sp.]NIU14299.1 hypothetical protein [candidate division Zixibacteria bacterium]NIV12280.1 hypothetical protein [Fodinibius sp.]NIY25935.1 hypothetical protein [Fodinibius sp.]
MKSTKISKPQWQKYFDTFSLKYLKDEQPEYIEIQVLSEDMGAQHEIGWTPLKGITYDPKSDILEIQIDKLDHLISHPEEIYVNEEDNGWLTGMMVVRRDGEKSIIDIR